LKKAIWSFFILLSVLLSLKIENHLLDVSYVIHHVPTSKKLVALTFDDGPLAKTTPKILSILKEKNVKATFFVVGEQVEKFPNIVMREFSDGHEIGNHTYSHPQLTKLSKEDIDKEMQKTETELSHLKLHPTLFRPPCGAYNQYILQLARDKGYITILWSIDTYDWRCPPVNSVIDSVLHNVKPGSIILLHDGKSPSPTPEALAFIIDGLRARGYEFTTVSDLIQYYESKPTILQSILKHL
jgi:polysaccharide deacetylase family sporulation protein PdaB